MFERTRSLISESGLWDGEREETHAFQMPTAPYPVSRGQVAQLQALGPALYACLQAVSRMFAVAADPETGHPRWWRELKRLLQMQVPDYFTGVQHLNPNQVPPLVKVDLVEDQEGRLWLVEVDAGNPRALGYSVLLRQLAIQFSDSLLPGVTPAFRDLGMTGAEDLLCVVSQRERWYRPAFEILARELRENGMGARVFLENDLRPDTGTRFVSHAGEEVSSAAVLYAPLVLEGKSPTGMQLLQGYAAGATRLIMPPKPFLGSKAVMALLGNASGDPILEGVLHAFVSRRQLEIVRAHLPETRVLDASSQHMEPAVLKALVSSGMKGVHFSSDPGYRAAVRHHLDRGRGTAIMQAEVPGKKVRIEHFTPQGQVESDERFLRYIAHLSSRGVEDVFVTAGLGKGVHGAKDAILAGCTVE